MEELDDLAQHQSVKPPAAARAGSERDVEGNADQAGTDARARQVLDESVGHRFKDISAAGAPQYRGVSCEEKGKRCRALEDNQILLFWPEFDCHLPNWMQLKEENLQSWRKPV